MTLLGWRCRFWLEYLIIINTQIELAHKWAIVLLYNRVWTSRLLAGGNTKGWIDGAALEV
jgi:hypothetical protein